MPRSARCTSKAWRRPRQDPRRVHATRHAGDRAASKNPPRLELRAKRKSRGSARRSRPLPPTPGTTTKATTKARGTAPGKKRAGHGSAQSKEQRDETAKNAASSRHPRSHCHTRSKPAAVSGINPPPKGISIFSPARKRGKKCAGAGTRISGVRLSSRWSSAPCEDRWNCIYYVLHGKYLYRSASATDGIYFVCGRTKTAPP